MIHIQLIYAKAIPFATKVALRFVLIVSSHEDLLRLSIHSLRLLFRLWTLRVYIIYLQTEAPSAELREELVVKWMMEYSKNALKGHNEWRERGDWEQREETMSLASSASNCALALLLWALIVRKKYPKIAIQVLEFAKLEK